MTAAVVATTLVTAGGQLYAGKAASNQARYEAKIDDRNAHLADAQAQDAQQRGVKEAQQYYRRVSAIKGQQQASMSANGVDTGFGSALSVSEDTAMIGSEDARTIYKNTENETQGYEINALNYRSDATAKRAKAKSEMMGAVFGAAGTALSGATQVAKFQAGR